MNFKLHVEAHLTEEVLVRFLDGELDKRAADRAARHLDSCWTCRSRREQLRQAMDRFVHLEEALINVAITGPPKAWADLRPRLLSAEVPPAHPESFRLRQLVQACGMLGATIAVMVWLMPTTSVSAMEILERSAASERPLLNSKANSLIRQQLKVESANRAASWSLWDAPQSRKFQQRWDLTGGSDLRAAVERIYSNNGLDWKHPLSASNHSRWRHSLTRTRDSVRREGELVGVVTTNKDQVRYGDITEAELWVRRSDWHPVSETFRVAQPGGAEEYRLVETAFAVEPLDAENARIFDSPEPASARVRVSRPAVQNAPNGSETGSNPGQEELIETEVEALVLLHEMGADLQDSAVVELEGSRVQVTAYTASEDRKLELESHLAAIPLVTATIHSLTDAPAGGSEESRAEVQVSPSSNVPPLFLKALVQQTGSLDIANGLVSDQMDLLRRLCAELESVEKLEERFPDTVRGILPARSVSKLDGLALDHLDAARQVWAELERNAPPLLAAVGVPANQAASGNEVCGAWYRPRAVLAQAAHRFEDLFARAFTTLAGAPSDISETSILGELPGLRARLKAELAEGCLGEK